MRAGVWLSHGCRSLWSFWSCTSFSKGQGDQPAASMSSSHPNPRGRQLYTALMQNRDLVDDYLSRVLAVCYQDKKMLCNPAISRSPSTSLLLRVVRGPSGLSKIPLTFRVFYKIGSYYLKSFVHFLLYLCHLIAFRRSKLRAKSINRNEDVTIINVFTMIDKILTCNQFDDAFFKPLFPLLQKNRTQCVVLCLLFGDKPWNMKRRVQTYNILSQEPHNFITEFELIRSVDWIALIVFLLSYPFAVLGHLHKTYGKLDTYLKEELVEIKDLIKEKGYDPDHRQKRLG
jgi:hypothetical protein